MRDVYQLGNKVSDKRVGCYVRSTYGELFVPLDAHVLWFADQLLELIHTRRCDAKHAGTCVRRREGASERTATTTM